MATDKKPVCPACGGTGQLNFFKGESRFLLSEEECPNCCGLGYLLDEERPDKSSITSKKNRQKKG
jgi:DnaJ-class molecular chaperone